MSAESPKMGEMPLNYIVVVQCNRVVHDVCSGFKCESAFHARTGSFSIYPTGDHIRYLALSCGGCPGLVLERRLRLLRKELEQHALHAVVHLSTCMTHDTGGVASCAFVDLIKQRIAEIGFTVRNHSHLSLMPNDMQRGKGSL